ncbi:MAG: ribonuclease III [candidate division Zixibacteria bacterium]|nr:ribonuclease III [candidate division Zixibacteria bacterium]
MTLWNSIRRLFSSDSDDFDVQLDEFQQKIGYQFRDPGLVRLSLTHRSIIRSLDSPEPSNERLEFLGDSVLGLIIAHKLYKDNPDLSEGDLTKSKAMLVNETTLAMVATEIGLHEYIRLSPEEEKSGGRQRASIVSDAFESVIGAVFLDGGFRAARKFVLSTVYARRDRILNDDSQRNYKGDLLELIQAQGQGMPRYDIVSEEGPDHDKTFHIVVMVNGSTIGDGTGSSKKEAEQRAACVALQWFQNHKSDKAS